MMLLEVDLDNSPSDTRLFLCRNDLNRTTIAELAEAKNRHLTLIYGEINQLTFSIPNRLLHNMKWVKNPNFDLIRGDYLIRYEKANHTIYFIITNPENSTAEDGREDKTVTCQELQYEWKNKLVRNYSGTRKLYDQVGSNGICNELLLTKTDWTVAHIDPAIASKYRSFDESQRNLLEFIYDAAESYGNVITVVDTVHKTVSFYLDENLGVDEGLSIEYGKYLKSITESENFEDVITRLYVFGENNVSIRSINPAGSDYLESLDFYMFGFARDSGGNILSHSPYLSDNLCMAIEDYNEFLASKQSAFATLITQKSTLNNTLESTSNQLDLLDTELITLENNKDVLIRTGGNLASINAQIAAKQTVINSKELEMDGIIADILELDEAISELREDISMENHFTPNQLIERNKYIKEEVWQDSKYGSNQDLYEEGVKKLTRISWPIVAYNIAAIDFVSALNTPEDWDKLKIGAIVTIRYPNYNIDIKAKIIRIEHDIDGKSIQLTIANAKDTKTGFMKNMEQIKRSVQTSTNVDLNKFKWDMSENNNSEIQQILNSTWDANLRAIKSGVDENYSLDRQGLTLKSPTDPLNYLRGLHNILGFTNDGGNTFKNALTPQGLNASVVIGQLGAFATVKTDQITIGSSLLPDILISSSTAWNNAVTQAGNSVQLGAAYNNVTITSGSGVVATRVDVKSRSIMSGSGFAVQKNTGTTVSPTWVNQIYADSNGDAIFSGNVTIGSGINIFKADSNGIYLGNSTFNSAPFRVTPSGAATMSSLNMTGGTIQLGSNFSVNAAGVATMTGANISGNINMTGGSISWGSVNKPSYSASDVGALASNSPMLTHIGSTGIYTGTLSANQINAGSINASMITTGSMSADRISGGNLSVSNSITLTGTGSKQFNFGSGYGLMTFGDNGNMTISGNGVFNIAAFASINIEGKPIATRDWVLSNVTAKFA